jgi:hypothetical protein
VQKKERHEDRKEDNMRFARTIATGLLLAIAPIANAQWSSLGAVTTVYSHDGNYFVIVNIADNPCGSNGKFWWPATDSDAKDMYAMALTALASEKRIAVVFNESAPSCSVNAALATHMLISQ